ncbi:MAG: alpha/beta hydrolase [Lachnospiraceae bacterium]|nr:alpha/beta hydrolase [Lachnospiraceae bacterium]
MSFSSYVFCRMCDKSDKKRDMGLVIPDTVEYVRNISYGENKKYHTLDICWPKYVADGAVDVKRDKLPVIISVHGGGYVYGSKEVYQFYAASLAEKGFAVVNYNYRLAPKYKFPAPLEDLNGVIKWLWDNKENLPVDSEKVFLVGDSAGAQIACQYGAIYSNQEYEKIMGIEKPKVTLRALGLCCGTYDLKKQLTEGGCKGALRDYLTKNPLKYGEKLNALEYITKDYPPVYLFSSKGDFLMKECKPMAEFLSGRGVPCEYKIYGNEQTGHVFHVDMKNEFASKANSDQLKFFKKFLDRQDCIWH